MTTNQTIEAIEIELKKAQNKDINITVEPKLSTSVDFLDVTIMNEDGRLKTSIYHKPTADPYYLPYTSDHPHRIHRNIPYSALLRAARLSSHVDDFNLERIRIDISLLLNSYPPKVITNQFLRFFQVLHAEPVLKQLDARVYQQLQQKVLYQPTRQETKLKDSKKTNPVLYPPVLQNKAYHQSMIYTRYTFETGPYMDFPREFYKWWKKYYQYPESHLKKIQFRLTPTTNKTLRSLLVHKKPSSAILTRMEPSNT